MEDRGFDLEGRLDALDNDRRLALSPADRVAERAYFAPPPNGGLPVLDADNALVFASDNYLGLTAEQRVQNASRSAAATVGTGSGSPRHVTGDTMVHHDLERSLAETTETDRTLVFPSRYGAAVGAITALQPDVAFVDECAHESLVDGCHLSGATICTYDHCDVPNLRAKMAERADGNGPESWLIVTESVYPSNGKVAPLETIGAAAEEFGAWVLVDETHAVGLYANGGGIVQAENVDAHVQVGGLGAALASQGGYVAGSSPLVECVINDARTFSASSGLSPPAATAASEALHVARHGDAREALWENVAHLRDGLETLGYEVTGNSHVLPVRIESYDRAVALVSELRERDVVVAPVEHVTIDGTTNGVRVTPMASHTEDDVVSCLEAFQDVGEELRLL